jgi:hypothetical protein
VGSRWIQKEALGRALANKPRTSICIANSFFARNKYVSVAHHIVLSVLLFRRASDPETWIAQALEHDIVAHGPDLERAKLAFERTVLGYFQLAKKYQQPPLASLDRAPQIFWDRWNELAQRQCGPVERIPALSAYMLPVVTNDPLPAGQ